MAELDLLLAEEPRPVTDPVRVQIAEGLEDRLRAVVLARMHGLAEERLVGDLIGVFVVARGVPLLLTREVDAHDEAPLVAEASRRARDLDAGRRVQLETIRFGHRLEEPAETLRPGALEVAHRAQDHAGHELRLAAVLDRGTEH